MTAALHVAMVVPPYTTIPPKEYGGLELVVADLVNALVKGGAKVSLFSREGSRTLGQNHFWLRKRDTPDKLTMIDHCRWALGQVAKRPDIDVVHIHSALEALPFAEQIDKPCVYTIHNSYMESSAYLAAYHRYHKATFISCSKKQQERLKRKKPRVKRLRRIELGLDPSRYPFQKYPGNQACFLGQLAAHKGVHIAIDAARKAGLRIRVGGLALVNADVEYWQKELKPRLGPDVKFLGPLNHRAKLKLFQESSVTICPFLGDETFGLVALESLLCGTPVVGFDQGAMSQLIEEGETGFIRGSVSGLAKAIKSCEAIDRNNCRDIAAKKFSVDRMAHKHLSCYQQLLR